MTQSTSVAPSFSPSEAAMEGFRIAGRNPLAIILWAMVMLLTSCGIIALFWSMIGPDLPGMIAVIQGGGSPEATSPMMIRMRLAQIVLSPLSMIIQAVIGAAILRAVLRPDEGRFGYLRLWTDEFLQVLVRFVISLVIGGGAVVMVLVVAILAGIGIVASGVTAARMGPAVALIVAPLLFALVGGVVYVAVKLSLAPAMTFDQRKFELFGSWGLTRGIFWRLVGAYLLGMIFCFMVTLGAMTLAAIFGLITYLATGAHLVADLHRFSLKDVQALIPTAVAAVIPILIGQSIGLAVMGAIPAYVYRRRTQPAD